MGLEQLTITRLRNLDSVQIEPCPGLNLVHGPNAAGKTTVLEAIYLLARGRSFRSGRPGSLVQQGQPYLEVFGLVGGGERRLRVGVRLGTGQMVAKLDGRLVTRRSELASAVAVTLLTPRSHELLERGPEHRRRFVDWAVFHVEHGYHTRVSRYQRALRQRNAALRTPGADVQCWDAEVAETGTALDRARRAYLQSYEIEFRRMVRDLLGELDVSLEYRKGWPDDGDLLESLRVRSGHDREIGFTHYGPHRADLRLKIAGKDVLERVSRGQQKMLVAALILARQTTARRGPAPSVLLIDDFASELDIANRERLVSALEALDSQLFLTVLRPGELPGIKELGPRMFHVEQGQVRTC